MKTPILIFTFLLTLLTNSYSNSESEFKLNEQLKSVHEKSSYSDGYTYVHVFKDGIWWIYVYDGEILIDYYPE